MKVPEDMEITMGSENMMFEVGSQEVPEGETQVYYLVARETEEDPWAAVVHDGEVVVSENYDEVRRIADGMNYYTQTGMYPEYVKRSPTMH